MMHNFYYYRRLLRNPNTGAQDHITKRGLDLVIVGLDLVIVGLDLTSPL
jgi:hypothetical protein